MENLRTFSHEFLNRVKAIYLNLCIQIDSFQWPQVVKRNDELPAHKMNLMRMHVLPLQIRKIYISLTFFLQNILKVSYYI